MNLMTSKVQGTKGGMKEMHMIRKCDYFFSLSPHTPPQVIHTAVAQTALPWAALNLSLLTPLSRTAPPNACLRSPGKNQEGFRGLPLPLLLMARRVQASGLQVQNPHQRRMQPKQMWSQTAKAQLLSLDQRMPLHQQT